MSEKKHIEKRQKGKEEMHNVIFVILWAKILNVPPSWFQGKCDS